MVQQDQDETVVAKAVAMCVLFAASLSLGSLPIKLSQWFKWKESTKNNIVVQILLCIGGGVLLCTTFLHLLPEVTESLENLEGTQDFPLPLAQLLMCTGFFLMYFVEECVHLYLHKKEKNNLLQRTLSIRKGEINEKSQISLENPKSEHADHSHADHSHFVADNNTIITIRGLLVVLALSVHELFEGLAVGLESSAAHVWYMFGAVSAHKLVIAFCIGIELVTSGMKTFLIMIYVFTFAIVSPLGIGIGILVSEDHESSTALPSVILQGLASGTLLYVVFFEILRTERKTGIKQYLAVLSGFIIMVCLTLLEG